MKRHLIQRVVILAVLATFAAVACSDDDANNANNSNNALNVSDAGSDTDRGATDAHRPDTHVEPDAELPPVDDDPNCDPLNEGACSFPWPSNLYLAEDSDRTTGYTLKFGESTLPANYDDVHISPQPYERLDGYGVGSSLLALFPNLDSSNMPSEYEVSQSIAEGAEIVWLKVTDEGAEKIPFWIDHDWQTSDPAEKTLYVHSGVILEENTRYVVGMRNLKDTDGDPIPRSNAFQALLDGKGELYPSLADRQARFDEVFQILEDNGVDREELTLAWDFHTASSDGLHGNLLHMRDEALELVGAQGPELTVTEVKTFTEAENEKVAAEFTGTIEVPNYLELVPGSSPQLYHLRFGEDGFPEPDGTRTVTWWATVPRSALDGTTHGLIQYGHGLLGRGSQVFGGHNDTIANDHDYIFFAADLKGMSEDENDDALAAVNDMSKFQSMADQLHQGLIDWVVLARAFKNRFEGLTEVQDLAPNGATDIVIDEEALYYSGISQGGIFGTSYVALSPDITLGHLGVPGINYPILLQRSVDFDEFFGIMRASYPSKIDQAINLRAIGLLWEATEPVSFVRHLEQDPFPGGGGTNYVLWAPAKGDHQVAVTTDEVIARTDGINVALMENYDDERSVDLVDPTAYPYTGSAVVLYDFGDEWPPPGNLPPVRNEPACSEDCGAIDMRCCAGTCCKDPHGKPRRQDHHNAQMIHFFESGGEVIDTCGGDGCHPD